MEKKKKIIFLTRGLFVCHEIARKECKIWKSQFFLCFDVLKFSKKKFILGKINLCKNLQSNIFS